MFGAGVAPCSRLPDMTRRRTARAGTATRRRPRRLRRLLTLAALVGAAAQYRNKRLSAGGEPLRGKGATRL